MTMDRNLWGSLRFDEQSGINRFAVGVRWSFILPSRAFELWLGECIKCDCCQVNRSHWNRFLVVLIGVSQEWLPP